jgi:hypothetical protein
MVTMGVREQMVKPATVTVTYFAGPAAPWSFTGNQFRTCKTSINGGKAALDSLLTESFNMDETAGRSFWLVEW